MSEQESEHNCDYCANGDRVPKEHWVCPVCDAEWPPEEELAGKAVGQ